MWIAFFLLIGLVHLMLPANALAIGRKPKDETQYASVKARKPIPPPNARDMQVSTGEIKPIGSTGSDEAK